MTKEGRSRPASAGGQAAQGVGDRIVVALPKLSKKQRKIARFVLDNRDVVAFASASDVGERTQSSAATVVRFSQALGYDGYPDLQAAIREGISYQRTAVQRLEARLASPIPRGDILVRVFAADIHNIERTAVLAASNQLQLAADEICRARQILVVGDGLAAALVGHFVHSLRVIGLPVRSVTGGGEALALALAFLQPQDVVVGIGFWRNPRDVVEAVQRSREIGATTIGITDSRLSPLARLPDYCFLVAADGVAHSRSPVAALSLLNAFVAVLSFDVREQVGESLRLVEEAYVRSGLLAE